MHASDRGAKGPHRTVKDPKSGREWRVSDVLPLHFTRVEVGLDELGWPALVFQFEPGSAERLRRWSSGRVTKLAAIFTTDGRVLEVATIAAPLSEDLVVSLGRDDQAEAVELVKRLTRN